MEKIEIKDFLGIKDITIEVKQINILIGSQATGKSVIAKLLYYFKDFLSEILFTAIESNNQSDFNHKCQQKFLNFFPPSSWGNDDFKIRYSFERLYIEIQRKKEEDKKSGEIILNYSEFYTMIFNSLLQTFEDSKATYRMQDSTMYNILSSFEYKLSMRKVLFDSLVLKSNRILTFNQIYIPAGRSFFSNLKSNIFALLSNNSNIDPFLSKFGTYYENTKK